MDHDYFTTQYGSLFRKKLNPSHLCAEFVGVADSGPAEGLAAAEVRVRTAGRRWYLRVVTSGGGRSE